MVCFLVFNVGLRARGKPEDLLIRNPNPTPEYQCKLQNFPTRYVLIFCGLLSAMSNISRERFRARTRGCQNPGISFEKSVVSSVSRFKRYNETSQRSVQSDQLSSARLGSQNAAPLEYELETLAF